MGLGARLGEELNEGLGGRLVARQSEGRATGHKKSTPLTTSQSAPDHIATRVADATTHLMAVALHQHAEERNRVRGPQRITINA